MEILLALFIFGQTYTDTTWAMYGGTLEHTRFQKMVGAMQVTPNIKWSYVAGGDLESYGAAVADVDGIAGMEVVIGSLDSTIYCLNGATGIVKWSYTTGAGIYSAATIADVDGIAGMDVIIGSMDNKVYCLDGVAGTVKWSYVTGNWIQSSPAIADIDGITGMEVVIGSYDKKVYCLDGVTGLVKWSYATGNIIYSSPAIADIDKDGNIEVVIGSWDKKVYCLNGATGAMKWSYVAGNVVYSSPSIADIDKDGAIEVVFGSLDNKVYCLTGATGLMEWSYTTGDRVYCSPAIADVDDDGNIEVVIGSWDSTAYCLDGATGIVKWSYFAGGWIHRGVSIADLDGDYGECKLEVLLPNATTDSLICLNGEDGSVLWIKELAKDVHDIIIADIDNDGCIELVIGTAHANKIWALDDVENRSDCKCDSFSSIEESSTKAYSPIEFKAMGKGIYLFTPNAVQVDINVYDISGRLEQTIYKGVLSKGGHTFMPNIKNSGVYFVTLHNQNFKKSLKLIKF